jgi:hypothetical protein
VREQPSFEPPRDHVDLDVAAILAAIPPATTTKRLFIDIAVEQVVGRVSLAELLARAEVDSLPDQPFDDVLWHDYFRMIVAGAAELQGPERLGEGLRQSGRGIYVGLANTVVGRLLLGRQLGDALRRAADTWQHLSTIGSMQVEQVSERNFRYHYERYPTVLTETIVVGIFEGLFHYFHMPVQIGLHRIGPLAAMLDMHW